MFLNIQSEIHIHIAIFHLILLLRKSVKHLQKMLLGNKNFFGKKGSDSYTVRKHCYRGYVHCQYKKIEERGKKKFYHFTSVVASSFYDIM